MHDCLKLRESVKEIKSFMDECEETKINEILKRKDGKEELVLSFFTDWSFLLHKYDQHMKSSNWDNIYSILLLSVLFEGFVKIVCFFENPNIILSREKSKRTLGKIKNEFKKILSKKEDNRVFFLTFLQ